MSVLLLNASYEPLRVISVKRAVLLLLEEKAVVVEEGDHRIRSVDIDMASPKVIRLNYFVQIPFKSRVPLNRRTLMARDLGECQYIVNGNHCQRAGTTIDHVKPRARGGLHEWTNTVACCHKHNQVKSDKMLGKVNGTVELPGWELKRQPQTPSGSKWLVMGIASQKDEATWEPYLAMA